MRMLRDNVLVKEIKKKQQGKIVMPDVIEDDWMRGEVVEVGDGIINNGGERIPVEVRKGDRVVFPQSPRGRYPAVNIDGEDLLILPEQYIWAIE